MNKETEYFRNGNIRSVTYTSTLNGQKHMHRTDGPAYIEYNPHGNVIKEEYYFNDQMHRIDGPAHIEYNDEGNVIVEWYYLNGHRHRIDGPAQIYYNNEGTVIEEWYYLNGPRHRTDGPAIIEYNGEGNVKEEWYYLNGKKHRTDGPAYIQYKDMKCVEALGYIDGKPIDTVYDISSIVPHNSPMIKIAQSETSMTTTIAITHNIEFIEDNGGSLF